MAECRAGCVRPKPYQTIQHCRECHQTFSSTTAGDSHRTGPHDGDRRCRTEAEMVQIGLWQDDRGVWRGRSSLTGTQRRHDADGTSLLRILRADQGGGGG